MEMRTATISNSWLLVQLQVTTMSRNSLVSANGNSYGMPVSRPSCGGTLVLLYYTWFLVMGNGDEDDGDGILFPDPAAGSIITDNRAEFRNGDGDGERNTLPGVRDRPLGTTVVGL